MKTATETATAAATPTATVRNATANALHAALIYDNCQQDFWVEAAQHMMLLWILSRYFQHLLTHVW